MQFVPNQSTRVFYALRHKFVMRKNKKTRKIELNPIILDARMLLEAIEGEKNLDDNLDNSPVILWLRAAKKGIF